MQLFEHFAKYDTPKWERSEFVLPSFEVVRREFGELIAQLHDDEQHQKLYAQLRFRLFDLLTVPVDFTSINHSYLAVLGSTHAIEQMWGSDVLDRYRRLSNALQELRLSENPLREDLDTTLAMCTEAKLEVSIFCQRSARPHFESLASMARGDVSARVRFLHSESSYRAADPFDTLIKVGPFHRKGYCTTPPALLNAARYRDLCQFVWAGLRDETCFELDPLLESLNFAQNATELRPCIMVYQRELASPLVQTIKIGLDTTLMDVQYADELNRFSTNSSDPYPSVDAVAIALDAEKAIPLRPGTKLILLEIVDAVPSFFQLEAGHVEPMRHWLVRASHGDSSFGETTAREGKYSKIWKKKLSDEMRIDPLGLQNRLEASGLNLDSLQTCLKNWLATPTTVIHAPQQRKHFRILIEHLSIEQDRLKIQPPSNRSWSEEAWKEIASSRGQAVQDGMEEHDLLDEEIMQILKRLVTDFPDLCNKQLEFKIEIPAGEALQGFFSFFPIIDVSTSVMVPTSRLNGVCTHLEIQQWLA